MKLIVIYIILCFSIISPTFSNQWSVLRNISELNSESAEIAPAFNLYENKLYFNSDRLNTSYYYVSDFQQDSTFSKPDLLDGDINQKRDNRAYISFYTKDEAYVSVFKQTSTYPVMNIHKSLKRKQQWQKPYLLDSLQSDAFTAQATVSPDKSFLIFVSNRLSNDSDTDLWIAFRQSNDTWGNAMPLEELNSSGNEITPFLASSDTLYFASNGQAGQGGYDLFISLRYDAKWSVPRPLNGLNTEFDESDFTTLPNNLAMFASNRPGSIGDLDLFLAGKISENSINGKTNVEYQISALVADIEIFRKEEYSICSFSSSFTKEYLEGRSKNKFQTEYCDQTFKIILSEIRLSGSEVEIQCSKDFDAKSLITMIESKLSSSISVKVVYTDADYITISVSNQQNFSPVEIVHSKTTADPPILELFLNARPEAEVNHWKVVATIGEEHETIYNSDKYARKLSYNLGGHLDDLWEVDSLNIELIGLDTEQLKGNSDYSFIINKKKLRNRTSIDYLGKMHEEYFLDLSDVNSLSNKEVIAMMLQNSFLTKRLQIIFPNGRDVEAAQLKGILISEFGFKKKDISMQEGDNKLGLNFLTRILVEKNF